MKVWLKNLPSFALLIRQISKQHFFLFSGIVCFFLSNSCQPPPLNNPCDPKSKAYISTFLGKAMIGDKSTQCGISFSTPTAPTASYTGSPFVFAPNFAITTVTPSLAGSAPTSCTAAPSLPAGLVLNQATCAISGTPTSVQIATSYTITPANSAGSTSATISIAVTSDGSSWTQRTLPSSTSWVSVTYGNGVFVAVAWNSQTAATSPDGITWTARTLPGPAVNWYSVTFGNGVFVAVAGGGGTTAARSTDNGITWVLTGALPAGDWRSVTFRNGVFVAVANGLAIVAKSIDGGSTWTSPAIPTGTWRSVAYGNGIFIAVANISTATARSVDYGDNWALGAGLPSAASWQSVTYGNGVFVAVASTLGVAATSPDGITWTGRTLASTAAWQSVTFGNGVFVVVSGTLGVAATSPDGITWTARTLPSTATWFSVTFGNGVFVAVASGSAIAATSP